MYGRVECASPLTSSIRALAAAPKPCRVLHVLQSPFELRSPAEIRGAFGELGARIRFASRGSRSEPAFLQRF